MKKWCGPGLLATVLLAPAAWADPSKGADWPQFRGPQQNGVSAEKGLLRSWPESGPKVLWKKPIGSGFSIVTVAGGALYTMAVEGESETAYRLRESDGEVVWRVPLGPVFPETFGNGPRSSPTVEGDVVYLLSATGRQHALKTKDGSRLWELDLVKELGGQTPNRGFASSPIVDGDLLILEAGGTETRAFVGLDKKTGKLLWSALDGRPGYVTPLAVTIDARPRSACLPGLPPRDSPEEERLNARKPATQPTIKTAHRPQFHVLNWLTSAVISSPLSPAPRVTCVLCKMGMKNRNVPNAMMIPDNPATKAHLRCR